MAKIDKIEELQNLLKEDSQNFQARRQLALLLTDCGFNDEALKNLFYLSKMIPNDSEIFYNLGIVYEKLKNLKKAKESYEKAIEIEPDAIDAIYNLGLVCTDLKEFNTAINCFQKVISTDESDSNSYFNLGLVYFKMNDFDNAKLYFEKTIELNREDIYAHFYLGNIFKANGDNNSARSEFENVLELSPDYSWAYYNLAVLDYENNDINSAINNLHKTIELNPLDIEAYKIYIKILAKIENYDEAEDILTQALDNCGENGDLYYIAGRLSKLQGDNIKYRINLQNALKNYKTLSISVPALKTELSKINI